MTLKIGVATRLVGTEAENGQWVLRHVRAVLGHVRAVLSYERILENVGAILRHERGSGRRSTG